MKKTILLLLSVLFFINIFGQNLIQNSHSEVEYQKIIKLDELERRINHCKFESETQMKKREIDRKLFFLLYQKEFKDNFIRQINNF